MTINNVISINDKVKPKQELGTISKFIGTVTGIASYIPTGNSNLMIVTFDEVVSEDGSTSVCIPCGHLVKV